jgi:hypothetical protein
MKNEGRKENDVSDSVVHQHHTLRLVRPVRPVRPVLLSRVALHPREVVVVDEDIAPDVKLDVLIGDDEDVTCPPVEGEAGPGEHEYIKQRPELEDGLSHRSVVYDHVEGR